MSISSEKLRKVLHPIQIDTMHFRFKPRRNPGSQSQHRSVNRTAVAQDSYCGRRASGDRNGAGLRRHLRSHHWIDHARCLRDSASRARDQRLDPGTDAPLRRGRGSDHQRHQHPRCRQLDPLARRDSSVHRGRRARPQLRGYQARHHAHLSVPGPATGHLLVSQPLRLTGAGRYVRRDHHRSQRPRAVPL